MLLEDYKRIIDEIKDKTFQVALGGSGDPDAHENFEELLHYAATNNVVPNFTTSGLGMTPEKAAICKAYCGAVAISQYSRITDKPVIAWRKRIDGEERLPYQNFEDIPIMFTLDNMNPDCYTEGENFVIHNKDYGWYYLHHFEKYKDKCMNGDYELYRVYEEKQEPNYTFKAIRMLLKAGVTTNIHYVLSNTTIDEAILRLKHNGFPSGINAVIFLLHKPVGLGDESDVLKYEDPRLVEFFSLIDKHHDFKIGFDSCTVPAILNFSKNIDLKSVDTCEAARFSMYITSDMIALPCSFDNVNQKYAFDLKEGSIQDAWDSKAFNRFRAGFKTSCAKCSDRKKCLGGCPLEPSITLCQRKEKNRWL
jgi:radical SAM protein with 4Fe4S-binding SPASM domain